MTSRTSVLVFKTDVKTRKKVKKIKPILQHHPSVIDWSVDIEDIDNVLRVEAKSILKEEDIILLMKTYGFQCEVLPD